jgi:hypothetical protein
MRKRKIPARKRSGDAIRKELLLNLNISGLRKLPPPFYCKVRLVFADES